MAHETEIKLAATPQMLDLLLRDARFAGGSEKRSLVSTYFDTHDQRLADARVRLRVRACGQQLEQTLKRAQDGGVSAATRIEHSRRATSEEPDLEAFPDSARRALERLAGGQDLAAVARTRIVREARVIRYRRATIEAAFDRGTIEAGDRSHEICELELELKKGSLRDLLALARGLPLGSELFWSVSSKGARAMGLASGMPERSSRPDPILLRPTMPVAAAFRRIGWNCLNHLLRNYRLMADRRDAEALHQCRVALRRLRIAAAIFRHIVKENETALLTAQWKAVADALGRGRSLDVMIARIVGQEAIDPHYIHPAEGSLIRLREAAYDEIAGLTIGGSFQRMLFDTALWIERSASRRPARAGRGREALPAFALRTIAGQRTRLKKPVRKMNALDARARHRLRIRVKRIRYTTEFFSPVLKAQGSAKRLRVFLMLQEALQDQLGDLNDLAPGRPFAFAGADNLDTIESAIVRALGSEHRAVRPETEKQLIKAANRTGKALMRAGKRLV